MCGEKLFGHEPDLNWVIFLEGVVTTRAFMRTVMPVGYSDLRDLLPRIHSITEHHLLAVSSTRRPEPADTEDSTSFVPVEAADGSAVSPSVDGRGDGDDKTGKRRNDDDAVEAARERYLRRRLQHQTTR
jgi:hypothetical protein